MHKLLSSIAVLASMVTIAAAYGFVWYTGTGQASRITFEGQILNTAELSAGLTVNLVYLGSDGTLTINADGTTDEEVVQVGKVAITGIPTFTGRGSGEWSKPIGEAFEDGSVMTDGVSAFTAYITYEKDGVTYYNYSSSVYTIPAGVTDQTPNSQTMFDFSWDTSSADTATAGGGWWTPPIPEPMTVICGLAGLALLLKRRA